MRPKSRPPRLSARRTSLLAAAGLVALAPGSALAQASPDRRLDAGLERLATAMRIARDRHFLKPEPGEMLDGALRGLLVKLDPDVELFKRGERVIDTTSTLEVGLTVRRLPPEPRRGSPGYRVIAARDESPAALAGLRAGDLVTHLDGAAVGDLEAAELRTALSSEVPGFITLRVERQGIAAPLHLRLERRRPAAGVAARTIGGALVVRPGAIEPEAVAQTVSLVTQSESAGHMLGIVLDLRDVGGESIDAAVQLADAFLDAGTIATFDTRKPARRRTYEAASGDVVRGKPVAVLVNAGTTNAADIVAAALKDHKRAEIVGTPTGGRAQVRELVPLGPARPNLVAMITTGRYLSPSGRRLDVPGTKPDIAVAAPANAPCRDADEPADDGAGSCAPRAHASDAQLQRALIAVTGKTSASAKP